VQRIRSVAEHAVQSKKISAREKGAILEAYETGMRGYTYFER